MESGKIDNKRITKNAAVLYLRMILTMFITFYASRVILEVLGVEDFGIYNVVWGVTTVVTFFSGSLTNVSQRYFNIALGMNDEDLTNKYFNQFLIIFSSIAIIVFILGEIFSVYVIEKLLSIPGDRIYAAHWVFQFSLLSLVLLLIQIPYQSLVIANERMNAFAYISLFESFSKLAILYVLKSASLDRLILYSILLFVISSAIFIYYVLYCKKHFRESRLKYYLNKELAKEMTSFVGYNVYGCLAFSLCQQGVNVLLNIFFGPAINAARAISMQIYQGVYRFSDNILVAVRPPIIKLYAQNEHEQMSELAIRTTKYCLFINVLIVLPVFFNIDYILQIWLKNVPDYTSAFVVIILIESFFNIMNQVLTTLANATGDLKRNQFYGRTFTLLSLPLAYVLLLLFNNPVVPIIAILLGSILYFSNNLYDVHLQLKMSIVYYLKKVILPTFCLMLLSSTFFIITKHVLWNNFIYLILSLIINIFVVIPLILFLFLDIRERNIIIDKIFKILHLR